MSEQTQSGGWTPGPDPSLLTTQQLIRELASLKENILTRLDAMDKAIILLQDQANRSPTINEVYLKHEQKFATIDQRFEDRKLAWDASLNSARESVENHNTSSALAISKSETSLTKQMDQLSAIIQAVNKTLDEKITDVKDRLTLIEGRTNGVTITERRGFDLWGGLLGGIGMLISVVTFIVFIFKLKP